MALLARPGTGSVLVQREVEKAGDVREAWRQWAHGHPAEARAARARAREQRDRTRRAGAHVVTVQDARYPKLLTHLSDPPPVLYALGTWPSQKAWGRALAVVGTRSCTPQGASWALQAGREWSEAGGTVVSGLARGIDGRAHQGVLNGTSPQRQVAVLPCSVEAIHPRIHRGLAEAIVEAGGLVVTEQPPGVQVERWMFASRNRILTGLAPSTVVIQSPARGGSLISARCARDQNRDVFALWQRGMGAEWAGNRALVADHVAHPVDSIDALWGAMKEDAESRSCHTGHVAAVPDGCREVWSMVDARRAVSWREMLPRFRGRAAELDRQLLTLELQGWIRRLPGRSFLRN